MDANHTYGDSLILDDKTENHRLLSQLLTKCDYHTLPSKSGNVSLISINATFSDLVLLYVLMLYMNGIAILRTLWNDPHLKCFRLNLKNLLKQINRGVLGRLK